MLSFLVLKNAGAYLWPLGEAQNNPKIRMNEFNYRRFSVRSLFRPLSLKCDDHSLILIRILNMSKIPVLSSPHLATGL